MLIRYVIPHPACHGCGNIIEHPCPECHGSGEVEQEEKLTAKTPVGIEEGMMLRIPGKGMSAPAPGDLFVVVRPHRVRVSSNQVPERFSREERGPRAVARYWRLSTP